MQGQKEMKEFMIQEREERQEEEKRIKRIVMQEERNRAERASRPKEDSKSPGLMTRAAPSAGEELCGRAA